MFDEQLRTTKERVTARLVAKIVARVTVSPTFVSFVGLLFGLGAAFAAAKGSMFASVALWVANRACDGLDGELARAQQRSSRFGGYVDLLFDVIVYAAVPFGIAWHIDTRSIWIAYGFIVSTFYVNTLSWNVISTLTSGDDNTKAPRRRTAVAMPSGLIEGAETIVAYIVFLLLPTRSAVLFTVFAILVAVTITQRTWWAFRHL
jgi:phosphatidylglycerophosphate synthase